MPLAGTLPLCDKGNGAALSIAKRSIKGVVMESVVWFENVQSFVLFAALGCSIYYDLRFRIIPNWLIVLSSSAAVVIHLVSGFGILLHAVWVAILLALPLVLGFQKGQIGGGDVKLVAAVALILGPRDAFPAFFMGILVAGLYSMYQLLKTRRLSFKTAKEKPVIWVPYGALYAVGVIFNHILSGLYQ